MPDVVLDPNVDGDLTDIWLYTAETWGEAQADRYLGTLNACITRIGTGDAAKQLYDRGPPPLFAYRCAQHVIFWLDRAPRRIVAILSPRMDLTRRLDPRL